MSELEKFLKKDWKFLVPLFFVLAIVLGLLQSDNNQYAVDNQSSEIKLSAEAQNELWSFYQKAQNFSDRQNPADSKTSTTFLAVGDIMLSRNVAQKIKEANDPLLPFSLMDDVFEDVDFSFGNLESPFSGKDSFNSTGSMVFNTPRSNIKGLVENKFKILNLANNHALDQGALGLEYTLKFLDENNIEHIGAGLDKTKAWQPVVIEENGIKICFVGASYSSFNDNGKTTNDSVARIEDLDLLKTNIQNLKFTCDFVVASMHAGTEYTTEPNRAQMDFAHAAIDNGADIVLGHHPHWIQSIEKYQDKYIFYSLGNFIFDQMWSQKTREGLTLKIQISKSKFQNELQGSKTPATLNSIELMPVIIDNYSTPRPANQEEAKKILKKIGQTETILK